MKYEVLLMYAMQKGIRQKSAYNSTLGSDKSIPEYSNFQFISLFNGIMQVIVLWSGLKYTITYHPLVVYMSLSSSFDIPGSPLNVSSGFSDVSGMNTSFGGSFGDP